MFPLRTPAGRWVTLLAALALLPSCDAIEDPGAFTLFEDVTFEFDFSRAQAGTHTAVSQNRIDLTGRLEGGFTKAEILSASVVSATLERIQPVGQDLSDLMDGATVQLDAAGLGRAEVAGQQGLPADNEAELDVSANANVTGFTTAPNFGAVLTLAGLEANDYVLEVTLRLRIEVEGV